MLETSRFAYGVASPCASVDVTGLAASPEFRKMVNKACANGKATGGFHGVAIASTAGSASGAVKATYNTIKAAKGKEKHHLVPQKAKRFKQFRRTLRRAGVGIHDGVNILVVSKECHDAIHGKQWNRQYKNILKDAFKRHNNDADAALREIAERLLGGTI